MNGRKIPPCFDEDAPLPPGVDRRSFLLAAAALALSGCAAGGGLDSFTAPNSVGASIDVTAYTPLANVGGVALVSVQGTPLAIVRTGNTTFLALSRICPHQGATIDPISGGFFCPGHGAQFNTSGKWVGGQPTSSMKSYPTTYDPTTKKLAIG